MSGMLMKIYGTNMPSKPIPVEQQNTRGRNLESNVLKKRTERHPSYEETKTIYSMLVE